MTINFKATELRGCVSPPPFKSEVIRCLILYAMAGVRPDAVVRPSDRLSDDIMTAYKAVDEAFFAGAGNFDKPIFAGGSATLLRLLAPVLTAKRGYAAFSVEPSLFRRETCAF